MISIVIPAFNEEKFLPECLCSLKNQDYEGDYEIIVADNGSTDNTARIARMFGAKVLSCPDVKNVFYARQVGADAASGEVIVQADADTIYPQDWLKRIVDNFASCHGTVAVSGRFIYRDPPRWAKIEYFLRHCVNVLTVALFNMPIVISGATFAYRRKTFLSLNGYRGLSYAADQYGISERLSKSGKVLYDKNICVATSARSARKPAFIILMGLFVHINLWSFYFIKSRARTMFKVTLRLPPTRTALRLIAPALFIIFILYGYFIPTSTVFGSVYYKGSSSDKVVALTFDDGPNEPYTSQILDILDSRNIKATFFLIGRNVELYPETAKRMIDEGHIVGNHSYGHNANHALTEYGAKDVRTGQEAINNVLGVIPHLYRPPHGKKSPWEIQAVKKEGLIEVTWSVSANDQHVLGFLKEPSPERFARKIVNSTHPGEIILLHDGYGLSHNNEESDKNLTVEALPLIIDQLQARGFSFLTVPELLGEPAYNVKLP